MELVKDSLDWLKLFRLANKNLSMSDEFEIKELPRLSEIVSNNSDKIKVNCSFYVENESTPCLDGTISLNVDLVCQRCLEVLPLYLDLSFSLAFLKNENQTEDLSIDIECFLIKEEEVSLIDLISDEILLSIPMAPKHNFNCMTSFGKNYNNEQIRTNPFAILKDIQKPSNARSKNGSTKK